jgi:hypothetical protein
MNIKRRGMEMRFFQIRVALFIIILLLFTACTKEASDTIPENVLVSEPSAQSKAEPSDVVTSFSETSEAESKTIITLDDINPDSFVYPNEPLTPESLSYIVNGALKKHMTEEVIAEDPDPPPHIYAIVLLDIDFDKFPEIVFKHTRDQRVFNTNKVYSLKQDNFGEFLCDFEAWGRSTETRFFEKESEAEKRFIINSVASHGWFGYSSILEITKKNGNFSVVEKYSDNWERYSDRDGIARRISTINGIEFTFDEYMKDLDEFTADLTELPIAETKIEYNYDVLSQTPLKLSPLLIYEADMKEQYAIYDEYLNRIKKGD